MTDSFTSERYFGIPSAPGGYLRYESADLVSKARKSKDLKDKRLFLLHGTADGWLIYEIENNTNH